MGKTSLNDASAKSKTRGLHSTSLIWTKKSLLKRLKKGPEARSKFVASQISNGIAFQIRALRNRNHLSQPKLAELVGTTQNQVYRLEKPTTAKPTITTLKKVAAAFDVALVVRFEPFNQLVDWVSGTPFLDRGLSSESLAVPSFAEDRALAGDEGAVCQKEEAPAVAEEPHRVTASGNVTEINHWTQGGPIPDQAEQAKGQQKRSARDPFDLGTSNSAESAGTLIYGNQLRPRILAQGAGV